MTAMSESLMRLHFLSLLLLCCVSPSSFAVIKNFVTCRPRQIQAFTQFKNEFDTSRCNHSDNFNGVWCDNSTGAVTKLKLRACLSGTLKSNSSLFKLHRLRYLDLWENNFISSSLPSEFGKLNRLEVLSLSSNGFLGQVPSSFNNLGVLSFLDLSYNHFSGTLNPNSSLFELRQLCTLDLGFNNFSSSLPSGFGNLNKLEVLSMTSSGFFGQVPPTISNLTRLSELYLARNKLTGSFPLVQNLTKLSTLVLHDNHFSGNIPSSLLTMPFLSFLYLSGNDLTGSIQVPNSFNTSRLEYMYLGHNHFERKIIEPISKIIDLKHLDLSFLNTSYPIDLNLFSSLKSLTLLDLSGNNIFPKSLRSDSNISLNLETLGLSGCDMNEFPNILKTLHNLEYINLSNNRINGKIPEWLWNLPRLSVVSMTNNSFDGFQGSAKTLVNSSVKQLLLGQNCLEGALPHLPLSINSFSARKNRFRGNIPLSICNRRSLMQLLLSYNNLTGPIPQCLSNLTTLDLRKNKLEGSLPDMFSTCASLLSLDVGYNRLTGKLPRSLQHCSSLQFLNVEHNGIEDGFPFWLKALPNLKVLTLRSNKFFGPISLPDQGPLGFPELRIFEISDNKFTGSLPPSYFSNWKAASTMNKDGSLYMEHQRLSYGIVGVTYVDVTYVDDIKLRYKGLSKEPEMVLTFYSAIDFSGNRIEGQIPESICLLKVLIALNLSNNAFTGHIPLSLSNLTDLESIDLSSNQLSGTIPNGLGGLSFMATNLEGSLPDVFYAGSSLRTLEVGYNRLTGKLPRSLLHCSSLQFLNVENNKFEDTFPFWLKNLPNLQVLNLRSNKFYGPISPPDQGHMLPLSINILDAQYNKFTGSIPLSICSRTSLTVLSLSFNNLTGPIPQCLSNLTIVDLRSNNLEGSIPDMFSAGASLWTLDVGYNRLTGKLPRSLKHCSSLEFLSVEHNKIKDTFPFWLKNLRNLQVLALCSNKFFGPISLPLGFPELRIFEISNNKFTGSLPPSYFVNWKASSLTMNENGGLYMAHYEIAHGIVIYTYMNAIDLQYKGLLMEQEKVFTSYATIDFSGNKLEGQIPESIGLLKELIALNLSNNAFSGHIPLSFSNLGKLESLDMSRNQLSGTIPNGLGTLSFLEYINVSHNQLKGEIPQGTQITGQPKSSFEENAGLCGLPLEDSCFGTNAPAVQLPEEGGEEDEQVLNWKGVAIGYGTGVLLGLAIAQLIASYNRSGSSR